MHRDLRPLLFLVLLALLTLGAAGVALAAPGDLDPTFGTGGLATFRVAGDFWPDDMTVAPDGKIILTGRMYHEPWQAGDPNLFVARFNSDGSIDPSFGAEGMVVPAGSSWEEGYKVALQPDGKIVVLAYAGDNAFLLHRFNADGSLDPTFDSYTGRVQTSSIAINGRALLLLPDGKILVGGLGRAPIYSNRTLLLARYLPNGTLDPTFGSGGLRSVSIRGGNERIEALALQPDGKIVAAGFSTPAGTSATDWVVVRFDSAGALDPTFGTAGAVVTDFRGLIDEAYTVAVQPDGAILVGGQTQSDNCASHTNWALARYTPAGALDATFDMDGQLITETGYCSSARVHDLALQADGTIVAAGQYIEPWDGSSGGAFLTVRYRPDGSLDPTFGDGMQFAPFFDDIDEGQAVELLPGGKILVGGRSDEWTGQTTRHHIGLARYMGGVENRAPVITTFNVPSENLPAGYAIAVNAAFTDVNFYDTHTGVWDWGDGTTSPATLTQANSSGAISDRHTYSAPGDYVVTLTVTDQDGLAAQQIHRYVSMYNPDTCAQLVGVSAKFNDKPIRAGSTIWFTSVVKAKNTAGRPVVIRTSGGYVTFMAGDKSYQFAVPKSTITLAGPPKETSLVYDGGGWFVTAPIGFDKPILATAFPFQVTEDMPGNINPVSWELALFTDQTGVELEWKWAAAVYEYLPTDVASYNRIGAKPTDGSGLSPYYNGDHAGTPYYFKTGVIPGARGGGGSNYIGSYSGTVKACQP